MKSLDIKTIAKEVIKIEAEAVSQIQKQINEDFEAAVKAILNCDGRLIVSGMGKSGLISQKIASTMASTGTPAQFVHPGEAIHGDLGMITDKDIAIDTPKETEVNAGHTCIKGRYAFGFYDHPDRLKTPLIKRNGKFEEASWDEAYDFIKKELNRIVKANGPDAVAGISSARCTNEENYVFQKMIRAAVGTNNIDCCARICHSPTAWGMQQTFGTGAATNSTEDIYHADLFMVIGANPTNAHPVTGAKIKQQVMKERDDAGKVATTQAQNDRKN